MKSFYSFGLYFFLFTIILVLSLCFFIPTFSQFGITASYSPVLDNNSYFSLGDSSLLWPTPGYTTITSGFGYRNAPTKGARNIPWWN